MPSPVPMTAAPPPQSWTHLKENYQHIRQGSLDLTHTMCVEDQIIQSMPDVSPTKWHLGHTTWFFERLILKSFASGYEDFDPNFDYLFNSYYYTIGQMHFRPNRGLLSRPTLADVHAYRAFVDAAMVTLLDQYSGDAVGEIADKLIIGLQHEQQHQELMLTDIKHVLAQNPFFPALFTAPPRPSEDEDGSILDWLRFEGGLVSLGYDADEDGPFAYDNEGPAHKTWLDPFYLASRPVTNGDYRRFIEDGGYADVRLWLSDGWAKITAENWTHPLYWVREEGQWFEFGLDGLQPLNPDAPVSHLSYYEAQAFAHWADRMWPGVRLPREAEWEYAARQAAQHAGDRAENQAQHGNLLDIQRLKQDGIAPTPRPAVAAETADSAKRQSLCGNVWCWTQSAYSPYPGFRPLEGPLGEYNGKFMSGQLVLKGGSCYTPRDHNRLSYRNFFPPDARWQMTGLRLARDL